MEKRGTPVPEKVKIQGKEVPLYQIWLAFQKHGGYRQGIRRLKWVGAQLHMSRTKPLFLIRAHYERYLYAYEAFLAGKPDDPRYGRGTALEFSLAITHVEEVAAPPAPAPPEEDYFPVRVLRGTQDLGYDRLLLALESGIPEEMNWAFGQLVLLSSEVADYADGPGARSSVGHLPPGLFPPLSAQPGLLDLLLALCSVHADWLLAAHHAPTVPGDPPPAAAPTAASAEDHGPLDDEGRYRGPRFGRRSRVASELARLNQGPTAHSGLESAQKRRGPGAGRGKGLARLFDEPIAQSPAPATPPPAGPPSTTDHPPSDVPTPIVIEADATPPPAVRSASPAPSPATDDVAPVLPPPSLPSSSPPAPVPGGAPQQQNDAAPSGGRDDDDPWETLWAPAQPQGRPRSPSFFTRPDPCLSLPRWLVPPVASASPSPVPRQPQPIPATGGPTPLPRAILGVMSLDPAATSLLPALPALPPGEAALFPLPTLALACPQPQAQSTLTPATLRPPPCALREQVDAWRRRYSWCLSQCVVRADPPSARLEAGFPGLSDWLRGLVVLGCLQPPPTLGGLFGNPLGDSDIITRRVMTILGNFAHLYENQVHLPLWSALPGDEEMW
ncbi:hypothetical protein PAPYR_2281 [Paratrimastix pyriformis]|uniref:ARID domain-containing protein n=1 Tax=Paratrimastix pyriformis TaxID=342808 RepID=A0ABQ8UWV2_9EUKA|nr:hypothetical protein PAPYR_2281 [Paratrimastix pyriformis]